MEAVEVDSQLGVFDPSNRFDQMVDFWVFKEKFKINCFSIFEKSKNKKIEKLKNQKSKNEKIKNQKTKN